MKIKRTLIPLSWLYSMVVNIRHWLFDHSIIDSEQFDIPIICIGNITVGGTGKTPMCELLLEHFTKRCSVAIISRGYGRSSKGYREVEINDCFTDVGDEPLQMKRKYPQSVVVVCEKRAVGIKRIQEEHPDVELIIMDDGFQHRYVTPRLNIIMIDATRPTFEDAPLPAGRLRDTPRALNRADIFVVTKSPETMGLPEIDNFTKRLLTNPKQSIYFTKIDTLDPIALSGQSPMFDIKRDVVAVAGVGNPEPFKQMLHSRYNVVEELIYDDHYAYTPKDLEHMAATLERYSNAAIITTEKDYVKFLTINEIPDIIKSNTYYTPIRMKFITESESKLLKTIENYAIKD